MLRFAWQEVLGRCRPGVGRPSSALRRPSSALGRPGSVRYARRAGTRAAGHFDAERTIGELWNDDVARPVAGGWPVLEVDTTARVDITLLVERIRAAVAVPQAVRSRP